MIYPKIGIRPTIDGRWGGVRESLEEKCNSMAMAAKKLLEENIRYNDGTPVKVIISDTTIGGGKEASLCEEQFSKENVVATLTVTPCWCYGTETFDMNPNTIKAIWGFNGTERPGAVYLAAVLAAHAQRGLPAFSIYGKDVQDGNDNTIPDDVAKKILSFGRCAVVIGQMKNKSYVNFGSIAMGIMGSFCDAKLFQDYFNIRAEWVDLTEILRRITLGIYDEEEYNKALKWIKANCKEGYDCNSGKQLPKVITCSKVIPKEKDWEFVAKMTLIVRDIMFGNEKLKDLGWYEESLGKEAIAGGFQGQRNWTDWLPNGDFMESIMASSFDWNGIKAPVAFATENDTLNGMTMLLTTLLTNSAPCFHDIRTYWSPESVKRVTGETLSGKAENGFIHLINSGATALDGSLASRDNDGNPTIKSWYDMTQKDVQSCLNATDWCRANYEYFRGGGFSSHFRADGDVEVTLVRLNIVDGMGLTMQIAEGTTVKLPDKIHNVIDNRTDKTWPTTWFVPKLTGTGAFKDVYSVMSNWGANHGVTIAGHVGADLITLASMLRIPVVMHNVDDNVIFRPHTWGGFSSINRELADLEACKHYGPIYSNEKQ